MDAIYKYADLIKETVIFVVVIAPCQGLTIIVNYFHISFAGRSSGMRLPAPMENNLCVTFKSPKAQIDIGTGGMAVNLEGVNPSPRLVVGFYNPRNTIIKFYD